MIRFLFRSAFLIALIFVVVAFLAPNPTLDSGDATTGSYNALDALLAVRRTITDLGNFCGRNPETCATGKSFIGSLGVKARDGARITYEFLDAKFGTAARTSPDGKPTGHADTATSAQPARTTPHNHANQHKPVTEKLHVP